MITDEEVAKMAKLAKFDFTKEELDIYSKQIINILNMIDSLEEVDCSNVEPLTSVCDMNQRMRNDEVSSGDISDQLFTNLANEKGNIARQVKCYVVPKVVE
ncbi:MAG: Asp-tRNA(Asn)/Glu-tRNA(Gln) amidotransferase subunit GatC [Rickettsia endosymbiont of Bryobia graminum]|nr:Asp-tRNA(Asn)/Glu-tRNA(Gln) amidotransferase subunit GatC [Rickettsia endosymbiont of Bryobia graminum]